MQQYISRAPGDSKCSPRVPRGLLGAPGGSQSPWGLLGAPRVPGGSWGLPESLGAPGGSQSPWGLLGAPRVPGGSWGLPESPGAPGDSWGFPLSSKRPRGLLGDSQCLPKALRGSWIIYSFYGNIPGSHYIFLSLNIN